MGAVRLLISLLASGLIVSAAADEVTATTLAQTARLAGDVIITDACHLRPEAWSIIATPAITVEMDRQAKMLSPSGGVDPEDVAGFVYASMNQAIDEGIVQWKRYGQAACKAIQDDGSLARIDALVAGFRLPKH